MTTTVHTQYSSYEIDQSGNRMRRLAGLLPPTRNQGADFRWKQYMSLTKLGEALLVVWGVDVDVSDVGEALVIRRTVTSDIVSVEGDPLTLPAAGAL